jgi:hypothetical protein
VGLAIIDYLKYARPECKSTNEVFLRLIPPIGKLEALPILSVYVGHSSAGSTQRYVRLTAEAYPELIEKVSRTCAYVLPEVTKDETN